MPNIMKSRREKGCLVALWAVGRLHVNGDVAIYLLLFATAELSWLEGASASGCKTP